MTRRKQYFEYLVKWKNHPVEYASWETEAEILEAWTDHAGAHGQEPMKFFKRGSMMQEHLPHQASQRRDNRTVGQVPTQILKITLEVVVQS
jgi:hypothetical protein